MLSRGASKVEENPVTLRKRNSSRTIFRDFHAAFQEYLTMASIHINEGLAIPTFAENVQQKL
eukprot:1156599-Pelagomonas_calceolata.AAC.8